MPREARGQAISRRGESSPEIRRFQARARIGERNSYLCVGTGRRAAVPAPLQQHGDGDVGRRRHQEAHPSGALEAPPVSVHEVPTGSAAWSGCAELVCHYIVFARLRLQQQQNRQCLGPRLTTRLTAPFRGRHGSRHARSLASPGRRAFPLTCGTAQSPVAFRSTLT